MAEVPEYSARLRSSHSSPRWLIARLDYSGPNVSAYLHQFTMLRLIDCRKDDVNWYQFLVTPEQNPEYFDLAS